MHASGSNAFVIVLLSLAIRWLSVKWDIEQRKSEKNHTSRQRSKELSCCGVMEKYIPVRIANKKRRNLYGQ